MPISKTNNSKSCSSSLRCHTFHEKKSSKWMFPNIGVVKNPPNHPFVHRVFHYKPSVLGYHYFWKHPNFHTLLLQASSLKSVVFPWLFSDGPFANPAHSTGRWFLGPAISSMSHKVKPRQVEIKKNVTSEPPRCNWFCASKASLPWRFMNTVNRSNGSRRQSEQSSRLPR